MNRMYAAMLAGAAGGTLLLTAIATVAAPAAGATAAPRYVPGEPAGQFPPKGYEIIKAGPLTAPGGTQTQGTVTCPGKKQPSGGGAYVTSSSLAAGVNSSYPSGQSWDVSINNGSGVSTDFYVYAVCLNYSPGYSVVTSIPYLVGDGTLSGTAQCPGKTGVLGGGAESATLSTGVNINSTLPDQLSGGRTAWQAAMTSSDSTASRFTVYAVCRPKPAGYTIDFGQIVTNGPGAQTLAEADCPGASVPIGGGHVTGFTASDTAVGTNATWPQTDANWAAVENNGGTASRTLEAAVVCAGS